jgi:hypothetical protein
MRIKASIKLSMYMLLAFLMFSSSLKGQNGGISELTSSSDSRDGFNQLVRNLHPTVYITNGAVKTTYGDSTPIKMTLKDANSINALSSLGVQYPNIELLTITAKSVSDLNSSLDLSSMTSFNNLKYVFLKCKFTCDEALLNQFINANSSTRIFYLCRESE